MRRLNSLFLTLFTLFFLAGCGTKTKIDLYQYKDVSSISIVDEMKADFKVKRPSLNPNITVDSGQWGDYEGILKDYFLVYNNEKQVFKLDQNGSFHLKLTLHNISSRQKFTPSQYVERKRVIKTDKGSYVKDESYYTDPYWTYTIQTALVGELTSPNGDKRFFHSDDESSYSITGKYMSGIERYRYVESIQYNLNRIFKQIANDVAPEGLVVSKKVSVKDSDEMIFLINMGKNEGLYESQKVVLYKEVIFKDEIEAKTITNKVRIGTATVSNQIMANYAWIVMDDEDHNRVIEVGDLVLPRY